MADEALVAPEWRRRSTTREWTVTRGNLRYHAL